MTKLELIQQNKKRYEAQIEKNEQMTGLSKLVGEYFILPWIKGTNWMGGLSDSKSSKAFDRLMAMGYEFDEIDDEVQRQMDEQLPLVESNNKTIAESLKNWDKKEFEDNSKTYELEMLYESVKTTLSAQQKNDLARFVRKAKTAEEINTYMTGMLAQDQMNESYAEKDAAKIENILVKNGIYFTWFDDNTIDFEDKYEAEKAAKLLKRFNGSIDFDENQLIFESFDKPPHEFWYYTKHGLGPGAVPKDVEILDVKEDDNWGTYIKLDKVLTTDELNKYEIKEKVPPNELTEEVDEESFNKLKEIAYELDDYVEDKVWVRDFWFDGQFDNTISFEIYGDWKHDHARFDYYAREWLDNKGLDYKISEHITDDDGSDSYGAIHTIRLYDFVNEGYIPQKPARFTNGQLKDFDPYTFMKNIMRSGKSMNSVRDCGPYQYTIFVNYKDHVGPKGIDDLDNTLYMLDIIREDQSGNQSRDITKKDLLWTEVAEALQKWKEETILTDNMRKNAAMPY